MVELMDESMNYWGRLAGGDFKPPNGAVVKSYGIERLGKGNP